MSDDTKTPTVLPFRALRPTGKAGDPSGLICPPYDVISPAEQARLLARSPANLVRLELPESEPGEDPAARAARAGELLRRWRTEAILAPDSEPAYYYHEQTFDAGGKPGVRRGFFARVRLEPASAGRIKPHERTLDSPKADRVEMIRQLRAQVSPVFGFFRPAMPFPGPLGRLVFEAAADGEMHRLWALTRPEEKAALGAVLDGPVYLADGHHRYAAALAYRDECAAAAAAAVPTVGAPAAWRGDEPECFVLMELVPANELTVGPWHRLVRATPAAAAVAAAAAGDDLRARLERHFEIDEYIGGGLPELVRGLVRESSENTVLGLVGLEPGKLFVLTLRDAAAARRFMPAERSEAWKALDVAVCQEIALQACLGIGQKEVAAGALGYVREAAEAEREVREGRARLAFLLNPTPVEQVMAVADAGDLMPQKSTNFRPKLPTGLALYAFD